MRKKQKIFLGLLLSVGLLFIQPSSENASSQTSTNVTKTDSDKNFDHIFCKEDREHSEELAQVLQNEGKEVNCLFGGCNSLF